LNFYVADEDEKWKIEMILITDCGNAESCFGDVVPEIEGRMIEENFKERVVLSTIAREFAKISLIICKVFGSTHFRLIIVHLHSH
jgi:hypothetical protein